MTPLGILCIAESFTIAALAIALIWAVAEIRTGRARLAFWYARAMRSISAEDVAREAVQ